MFQEISNSIFFYVKIIAKASKNKIIGWEEEKLKIKIKALAEKNKANQELISFLAQVFDAPKSTIKIVKGKTAKIKRIEVKGFSLKQANIALQKHLAKKCNTC